MENFSSPLGNRKPSGMSCSVLNPWHIVWQVEAHAGHRAVMILILPYSDSLKLRPGPRWVLRTLKVVTNASHKPAKRMQSLSLGTAILNSKSLKIAIDETQSPVPGQRERKDSNRVGHRLLCRTQSSPQRTPRGIVEPGSTAQAAACDTHARVVRPTKVFQERVIAMLIDTSKNTF